MKNDFIIRDSLYL